MSNASESQMAARVFQKSKFIEAADSDIDNKRTKHKSHVPLARLEKLTKLFGGSITALLETLHFAREYAAVAKLGAPRSSVTVGNRQSLTVV